MSLGAAAMVTEERINGIATEIARIVFILSSSPTQNR